MHSAWGPVKSSADGTLNVDAVQAVEANSIPDPKYLFLECSDHMATVPSPPLMLHWAHDSGLNL